MSPTRDTRDTRDAPARRPDGITELPLTLAQQRLWFIDRLDPRNPPCVELIFRLRGRVDGDALAAAVGAVVDRHESLRARFLDRDGDPVQVICPPGGLDVARIDLTALPADERQERARTLVTACRTAEFDLRQGPPLRAMLLRLGTDDHILCLVLHHIVADGASQPILVADLRDRYLAALAGNPSPPAPSGIDYGPSGIDYGPSGIDDGPSGIDYGDFALWQRAQRERGQLEDLRYWRDRLAGAPVLELPTDLPRPPRRQGIGGTVRRDLGTVLAREVERLARTVRCTPFMVLLAAFQVLLCRYSGQVEVCVGSPIAGRSRPEFEELVGLFINLLVLRGDLAGDPTFRELLVRTRTRALEAYAHQEIPFEQLIGELDVPRDPSRTPLFQTMFVLHSQEGVDADEVLPGVRGEYYDSGYSPAAYDLACDAWLTPDGLAVLLRYDAALFNPGTVEALADRFETLLNDAVAHPDRSVSRLRLDSPAEAARTLALGSPFPTGSGGSAEPAGGGGGVDGAAGPPLVGTFARQAARNPGAIAVSCGGTTWTYAELDRRADRLADLLRRQGVGIGTPVGVCLPRSPELIAALLAVWKAGGTQVPLDPAYPTPRLHRLLADTGTGHLVSTRDVLDRLGAAGVIRPDGRGPAVATLATPGQAGWPGGLAYVIHTSGSTGAPKGVAVPHQAVRARVRWMREYYRIEPGDRVLQFASTSFDTHVEEVYPTLTAGAELVLLPPSEQLPDFLAGPDGSTLTVLDLPTPYWHELVTAPVRTRWPRSLRLVIIGADQAHQATVAAFHDQVGDRVALVNTYGPTETTVIATAAALGSTDATRRPPIGRPIDATRCYVLDDRLEPVPRGVPGELFIAGGGLAVGYVGRPGLTASRFLPDPYGPLGERMYRTGDRVRWCADGQLEFLGRLDHQVKIRGYRIEPGEIEAHLLRHPDVAQAVVVPAPDSGGTCLVAYVVGAPGRMPDAEVLRAYLGGLLPVFMVPTTFVILDRLPLTASGKPDRAALPTPPRPAAERAFVAPRSEAEQLVADIWAEVLDLDRVAVGDDFFALGGHSLMATKVIGRLSRALAIDLPIRLLFAHATVAGLARAVGDLLVAEIDELSDEQAAQILAGGAP